MKISKLLGSSLLLVSILSFSTKSKAQELDFGIRGGGLYSNLLGIDSAKFKPGITGGLTLSISNGGHWSTTADLLYSQRGTQFQKNFKDTTSKQTEKFEYTYTLNYVEIPVLFHYNFLSDSSNLKLRGFFGPSLNLRTKANSQLKYTKIVSIGDSAITTLHEGNTSLAYTYTPFDFNFVAGVGASYVFSDFITFSIDVRANYGLLDIREYLSKSSKDVRNVGVNVLAGVTFRLSELKGKGGAK